ncbi:hypothetical protein TIFTF001_007683 [Ficus carica]|uniref:Uncharacterized protein n=1 Tax=Ficus carica TaxID=3494 RepID=A0AA88ADT3_FICCA|nr:hypothetical protein TIFTF001_007683 [Ficus carica]
MVTSDTEGNPSYYQTLPGFYHFASGATFNLNGSEPEFWILGQGLESCLLRGLEIGTGGYLGLPLERILGAKLQGSKKSCSGTYEG